MKKKNYLIANINGGYNLAKGESFQCELEGLALVRFSIPNDNNVFKGDFAIIDIASGMFVTRSKSKKKLLERWEAQKEFLLPRIVSARSLEKYKDRVEDLENEARIWRISGYEI